jgi:hypothetical protein
MAFVFPATRFPCRAHIPLLGALLEKTRQTPETDLPVPSILAQHVNDQFAPVGGLLKVNAQEKANGRGSTMPSS